MNSRPPTPRAHRWPWLRRLAPPTALSVGAWAVLATSAHAADPAPAPAATVTTPAAAQQSQPPFDAYETVDTLGRKLRYYLSRPAQPAPLLVMIQGSGCDPVVYRAGDGGGQVATTLFNFGPLAQDGRFAVLAVEKPDANPSPINGAAGQALQCSPAFNQGYTAESWRAALQAAMAAARRMPWVAPGRTIVLGYSEGAVMAAVVAGHDASVTEVIGFGSSGTSQLFDFVVNAYKCFEGAQACLDNIDAQLRAIQAKPDSAEDFAWGHPYKRWTSFFQVSPLDELRRSRARIYLVSGTADTAVPILSTEVLAAGLRAAGRDVTMRRVPNADHSLNVVPGQWDILDREFRSAIGWVLSLPTPPVPATPATAPRPAARP